MRHARFAIAGAFAALGLPLLFAQSNVLTFHNDLARTGQNLTETILTPANVNYKTFGKIFLATLDSRVDAQPLIASNIAVAGRGVHNVLIVATENDSLYALDAATGSTLWHSTLLNAGETAADEVDNCGQVRPTIGITSTPVISLNGSGGGTIYAVAMSQDAAGRYYQRLHAIDITNGAESLGGPVTIQAKYPGAGAGSQGGFVVFDPEQYVDRAALLLLNGVVYMGWGSHCDHPPYTGWIMGYSAADLSQVSVINVTPNGHDGSIWGAGAGPSADSSGNIYFLDANGTFDTTLTAQGMPAKGDYGNAFIKLSTSGGLGVADYFAMYNTVVESDNDLDLGSGGSLVLPDMQDSSGQIRHLAVGGGKDANIYVVDRDNMGKFNASNDDAIYQELSGVFAAKSQIRSSPAYFNGHLYYCALADHLRALPFTQAKLSATPSSMSTLRFPYPGATPSISANGSKDAIVWVVQNSSTAMLRAYSASNLAHELYTSGQAPAGRDQFGAGNKFMVPTVANGMVYVGTPSGVAGFGLLGAH